MIKTEVLIPHYGEQILMEQRDLKETKEGEARRP